MVLAVLLAQNKQPLFKTEGSLGKDHVTYTRTLSQDDGDHHYSVTVSEAPFDLAGHSFKVAKDKFGNYCRYIDGKLAIGWNLFTPPKPPKLTQFKVTFDNKELVVPPEYWNDVYSLDLQDPLFFRVHLSDDKKQLIVHGANLGSFNDFEVWWTFSAKHAPLRDATLIGCTALIDYAPGAKPPEDDGRYHPVEELKLGYDK